MMIAWYARSASPWPAKSTCVGNVNAMAATAAAAAAVVAHGGSKRPGRESSYATTGVGGEAAQPPLGGWRHAVGASCSSVRCDRGRVFSCARVPSFGTHSGLGPQDSDLRRNASPPPPPPPIPLLLRTRAAARAARALPPSPRVSTARHALRRLDRRRRRAAHRRLGRPRAAAAAAAAAQPRRAPRSSRRARGHAAAAAAAAHAAHRGAVPRVGERRDWRPRGATRGSR